MATLDRFKEAVDTSTVIDANDLEVPLSAQMKYDYLAAIHTMEQLEKLAREFENRKRSRATLKDELFKSCKQALKKLAEDDKPLTMKKIDDAIKTLSDCRREIMKIDSAAKESDKLAKLIKDGVSAGD
ncbi:MAG: hypothetical protein IKO05_06365 [Selenomonadaceae bacterium]|nr:hypothetical protein [Selenomonadaceae bacterium]